MPASPKVTCQKYPHASLGISGNIRGATFSPRVWDSYEAILDACCDAWSALIAQSEVIASIGTRDWEQVKI
jgi:hypothetical protein